MQQNKLTDNSMGGRSRDGNVEFGRCLLMYLIVLGHCCHHGAYGSLTSVTVLSTITCFAVDAFAFISGWFTIRTTPMRLLRFVGYGLFAALIIWCLSGRFNFRMGWYGSGYLVLMLLAPFLNGGIEMLTEKNGRYGLYGFYGLYMSYMILTWLPFEKVGVTMRINGWSGHSVFLLIGIYLTGRVMSMVAFVRKIRIRTLLAVFFAAQLVVIGWSGVGRLLDESVGIRLVSCVKLWDNQSPFIIIQAIVFFCVILRFSISRWLKKTAVFAAPSMFLVYLLHDGTGRNYFAPLYSMWQEKLVDACGLNVIMAIFITSCSVFCICLCIDLIRRLITNACIGIYNHIQGGNEDD